VCYCDTKTASLLFLPTLFLSFCPPFPQAVLLLERRRERELLDPVGILFLDFFHREGASKWTLVMKKMHYLLLLWREL